MNMDIKFTYVKWNEAIASKIEDKNEYKLANNEKGSDMIGWKEGLEHNWIIYRYFEEASCENHECLDAAGS
jgi:hypothetical protein